MAAEHEAGYLQRTVGAALAAGCAATAAQQPADPVEYLGRWLLKCVAAPPPPPPPRPPRADPPPSMFARGMRAECPGRGDRGSGSARASAAPRARGTPPHQRPVQCPVAAGRRPPGRSRPRAPSGPQPVPPSGQRTQAPSPARGKVGGGAGRGGGGGGEWGAVWRTAHGF